MQKSRMLISMILLVVFLVIFSIATKHVDHRQRFLLGLSFLIVAVGVAAFNLVNEAKIEREQALNNAGNAAQFVGFLGTTFGFYYANQHPQLFLGYGIFLASWLLLASVLYMKLRKKGYKFLKKRIRPDDTNTR